MGLVPQRRTGARVTGFAEVVDGLTKAIRQAFCAVALFQPPPVWWNIESRPVMEYAGGRVRIVADKQEAARALWDTRPGEWRRHIIAVAGIFIRNVATLSKGRAGQAQRHIHLHNIRSAQKSCESFKAKANGAERALTHINERRCIGG